MKRKLWAVGQEQASSLPTRLHTPLHRGFPTACHWRDCLLQEGRMKELDFCLNPSDEQCCHLVAVLTFSNKIWEIGCKLSGLWYMYWHPIHHCTSQNTDTDIVSETITGRTVFCLCSVTIFIGGWDESILQIHSCFIRIRAHSKTPPVDMVGVTFRVNPSQV